MRTPVTSLSHSSYRFKVVRAFKALDDGERKKWVLVVAARDLPVNLPLDANARVPNVIKNRTCEELRETLLLAPELFQIFNGGIVCTATSVEVKQEGTDHVVEVHFDADAEQGIVNGGHSYATLLHVLHDDTTYSEGKDLRSVLARDVKAGLRATMAAADVVPSAELTDLVLAPDKLAERVARARERAQVQVEIVAPVADSELLVQIARARNLSQSVEATAFANLAGKFDPMKEVLSVAPTPFGPRFVERVVWKTNQEVPDDSTAISVKTLVHLLALMNTRAYPPATRVATDVYMKSGVVVREFGEAEGEDERFYSALTRLLPEFVRLYDHIYQALPDLDPAYPWADGKLNGEPRRKKSSAVTPLLSLPCASRVYNAFVWPIFSAFRLLLEEDDKGALRFRSDPVALFDEMRTELVASVKSFHKHQAHGLVQQVGKDKELWLRLQAQVETELKIKARLAGVR